MIRLEQKVNSVEECRNVVNGVIAKIIKYKRMEEFKDYAKYSLGELIDASIYIYDGKLNIFTEKEMIEIKLEDLEKIMSKLIRFKKEVKGRLKCIKV